MKSKTFKGGFKEGFILTVVFVILGTNWDATFCTTPPENLGKEQASADWWCQPRCNDPVDSEEKNLMSDKKDDDLFGPWQTRPKKGRGNENGNSELRKINEMMAESGSNSLNKRSKPLELVDDNEGQMIRPKKRKRNSAPFYFGG